MIFTILYTESYVYYLDEILENGSSWKLCPTHNNETFAANKFCSTLIFYVWICNIIAIKLYFIVKVIPTYEE
jgi:hypothetical protein